MLVYSLAIFVAIVAIGVILDDREYFRDLDAMIKARDLGDEK